MDKCVYIHCRKDTGEAFYVGSGSPARPFNKTVSKGNRTAEWGAERDAHGLEIVIVAKDLTTKQALDIEVVLTEQLIAQGHPIVNKAIGNRTNVGRKWGKRTTNLVPS